MTGIIILAAGKSERLGQPKQQLLYQGNSLLQHRINIALQSPYRPIIVVLGAFADEILERLTPKPIDVIINTKWEEGMASSIRAGIDYLQKDLTVNNVLIMLCDQPHVDAALLNKIVQTKNHSKKGIVACAYDNALGVPALFDKHYFPELLSLSGNQGAKKVLTSYSEDIATVPFPMGAVDIDTIDDYNKLTAQ